jgi:serine/threonine-protein kinase RsbT
MRLIRAGEDVVAARQLVREFAILVGMSLVDQTKIVTAASELARNVLQHGGGTGSMRIEAVNDDRRRGVRLVFEDHGPGIPDVEKAMKDGFSTGGGLGLGLGGAKRLSSEFSIDSAPGQGTRIAITRWK